MPRKREVFPTKQVIDLWVHKQHESARNAQRNVYIADGGIWSYGSHFCMAQYNGVYVLVNSRRFSVTTSKHQNYVASAIYRVMQPERIFNVSNPRAVSTREHEENLAHYATSYAAGLARASRARSNVARIFLEANDTRNEGNRYAVAFQLEGRIHDAATEPLKARVALNLLTTNR